LKYLSVCSGIEAASVAWHPLGWTPLAFSEIEAFPRAVLEHHYPDTPLHGDFTVLRHEPWIVDADVLVGGTPCQAFSVAGLRKSLDDDRGNLSLEFIRLADSIDAAREAQGRDPSIIVWENVPGVLSVKDNAFGCFLAALAGEDTPLVPTGGKWTNAGVVIGPARSIAWRVLDAQYFGLAQRRRRVFVVASARDGFDPAAVLLEFEGVRRDTPPRRETGQVAPTIPSRSTAGGGLGTDFDCDGGVIRQPVCMAHGQANAEIRTDGGAPTPSCIHEAPIVAHSLRGEGFDAGETGKGDAAPCVAVQEVAGTLGAGDGNRGWRNDLDQGAFVPVNMAVRRLTPVECERLQGFSDGYTNIPWRNKPEAPDGPRYKALGNSMAVPVMRWIGQRIATELSRSHSQEQAA
jgi:DNA (cytosine-5)-methyltransferase 1